MSTNDAMIPQQCKRLPCQNPTLSRLKLHGKKAPIGYSVHFHVQGATEEALLCMHNLSLLRNPTISC